MRTENLPQNFSPKDFVRDVVAETLASLSGFVPLQREFLTFREAATFCGIHVVTLRKLVHEGRGPKIHGSGRFQRAHIEDLRQWLRDGGAA